MKNISILGLSLLIGLSCGCSDELENQGTLAADGRNSLVATIGESIQSRTTIAVDGVGVLWAQDDAIGVYTSESKLVKYTLQSGVGEKTAVFGSTTNLNADETPLWAVYPYNGSNVDASTDQTQYDRFKMTLPATMEYSECSNGPMFAVIDNGQLSFNHMTGLLCIPVSGIPATAKTIKIQAPGIAGDFYGQYMSQTGTYTVPALASISNSAVGEINITLPDGQQETADLYIPLVAKQYAYLNLFVLDSEGNAIDEIRKTTSFTVEKGHIYTMAEFAVSEPVSVSTKEAFYEVITVGNPNITVTETIELDQNIELAKSSKITFNVAPTIAEDVVFKAAENATVTSFTLSYPYNVAENNATTQTLNIELPDCDVNLLNIDESSSLFSTLRKSARTEIQTNGNDALISKVNANVSAKSIVIGQNAFFDRMSITGTDVQINLKGFLMRLTVTAGSSATVTKTQKGIDGGTLGITEWMTNENPGSRSLAIVPSNNASVWDGESFSEPELENGVYQIMFAEELAWFQTKVVPTAANASVLPITFDNDAILLTDIDLAGNPWAGAVIGSKTFDGNEKTIYNLNMSQYILDQQGTIYSPEACVGLFAAVYGNSTIKDLTLDGVEILPSNATSPKWVGSLVGYSLGTGTVYENCIAKNVNIFTHGQYSYRVGGLIGYIEKSRGTTEATATLTGCEVQNARIAASYSYGGLVGSLFDSVTFDNCHTSNITLSLNGENKDNYGYVSGFIGDVTNSRSHSRVITIKDCTAAEINTTNLGFENVAAEQGKTGTYVGGSAFVGVVDYPEQITIKVITGDTEKTLVNGTDFNKYVNQ